jgi:D-methionine transport system substrate-binding protein
MHLTRRTLLAAAAALAFAAGAHAKDPKELVIGTSAGPYAD